MFVSVFAGTVCATSSADQISDNFTGICDNQNDFAFDDEKIYLNQSQANIDSNSICNDDYVKNTDNDTAKSSAENSAGKLNITGPKNDSGLKINGPKFPNGKKPVLTLSQYSKDKYRLASYIMDSPTQDLWSYLGEAHYRFEAMYYGDQLVNLVREAHSIALAKYHGPYNGYRKGINQWRYNKIH